MAAEENFLVAACDGEISAALEYRTPGRRLLLGFLACDLFVERPPLARALYAEAHAFAREMGLEEVWALPLSHGEYPYEVGYRRRYSCWRLGADEPLELRVKSSEGLWDRARAMWGSVPKPLSRGVRDRTSQRQ